MQIFYRSSDLAPCLNESFSRVREDFTLPQRFSGLSERFSKSASDFRA